jgi:hypothetical protein
MRSVDARVAGLGDLPLAAELHVLVVIEGRAPDGELGLDLDDDVVQGPDAGRGGRAREVDLRLMHAMARDARRGAERVLQEGDDRVAPVEAVVAVAVGGAAVGSQAVAELVPALRVETPDVAVLEPLDRLQLLEIRHA